jgi:ABC-type transport system involved in cytochrome c biogenesis permease subunit
VAWPFGGSLASADQQSLPNSIDPSTIQAIVVQHDGRWMPLDTVARDVVQQVTGTRQFRGQDAVIVLLAWTFNPAAWRNEPLVTIGNADLRRELELPADRTVFSSAELLGHQRLRTLIQGLRNIPPGRKPDPLESKVSDISEKLMALQETFSGQVLMLIPDPAQPAGAWRPILPSTSDAPATEAPVREAWAALAKAFLADDAAGFATAARQLGGALAAMPAAHRPSKDLIETELRYNRLCPFSIGWMAMAVGVAAAALAMIVRRRWFDVAAALPCLVAFVIVSYGLLLRWQIAGRIPASNMYESLLFLGWGVGIFAILTPLIFRQRLVPLTASFMAALSLFLADVLPLDPFVRPVVPVLLDTAWMAIHVPIIMVSYSVLALGVLVAHVQLGAMAFAPGRRSLWATIDSLHYWYVHVGSILLTAGIITGSMWAASSWGRYWGWDPKEVWSLVALLGYLTILHTRLDHERRLGWMYVVGAVLLVAVLVVTATKFEPLTPTAVLALSASAAAMAFMVLTHGPFATAVKSILCFWMVLMTYVGVNYVLGIGLHSYGFGTGMVARKMMWAGGIDLAVVGVLGVIYLTRRPAASSAGLQAA